MFTQPCLIRKNTKELVKKLEEFGYDYAENGAGVWFIPLCQLCFLGVNLYSEGYYMGINGVWSSGWYDCAKNEDLFLALAALRDDTDKNQWFVYDDKDDNPDERQILWFICEEDDIKDDMWHDQAYLDCHKATVQELIQHFKK